MTRDDTSEAGQAGSVHRPPEDKEETYFDGAPSLKGDVGTLLLYGLLAVVALGLGIGLGVVTGGLGWAVGLPLGLLAAGLLVGWPVIMTKLTRYKITNYRIDYERGLLSKRIDTLELWHVEDIAFHQSLWDRIMGVGTLKVMSHDDTFPELVMKGLPEPRKLFDVLKQRVISVKRQRGVLKIDQG